MGYQIDIRTLASGRQGQLYVCENNRFIGAKVYL